ncbi:MAG TPA: BTAD domain-containing putative transcriptional regulator [Chloroflexota bacterium]|nr:BTAD domain-containing putative transcriptional regulator [Chloroflexota bacterium]
MTEPQLHITLFGEFGLVFRGKTAPSFSGDRPISLLAYLLLHRHTAVSRQYLAFTLWPDSSDSQARANLRNLFYTLRQTLPNADAYLVADSMTLQWRADASYTLDVAEFEAALAAAKTAVSDTDKLHWLETAVSTYTGDLLPGNYEDWIIPRREALRQAYQEALHQLVYLLEQSGHFRAAARYGQTLIQHDPLDETTYVQLMRLQALSGDRAGVRRVYEQCVTALRRELDVEPGPATQAAYEELMRLEASAPPVPTPETRPAQLRPSPLPVPATPFIGREAELAHLAERLADPTCRLLTIVGPGGIGKTRLALQTAVGHQPVFTDGVVWVSLGALQTPDQVAAAIAEALHYRLSGAGDVESELLHVLATRHLLLVLDNFEHLLSAADFVMRIVGEATAVKLLITSRQALELQEEWRFDLGELPVPDVQVADSWADNSAVQLFVQSARRVASARPLTEADYPAIAHICRLVGGMPLGIELAASWARLLSCAEIAQEIEKSLDFLTVSLRHVPLRHRSLRAVFDYSWDLLTPAEQQILLRLSIFQGGFTRAAAAQVALADLPQLSALADRSLVQRTAAGRYSLHNIIRQFAGDRLQADPDAYRETAERHGRYTLQWLAEQDTVLRGPGQKDGLTAVADEQANIRTAWEWGTAHQWFNQLRSAAFALFYFCELRGLIYDGEALFRLTAEALQADAAESAAADDSERQITVWAMRTNQAYFLHRLGQTIKAHDLLQQAVTQLEVLGEEFILSYSLRYLGLTEWVNGRFDVAFQLVQRAYELAACHQDQWGVAISQAYLGVIIRSQGHLAEAVERLTAVLSLAKLIGDPRLIAYTLLATGRANLNTGHLAEANQQLLSCLEMARETNDFFNISNSSLQLGLVKQAQGDFAAARQFIQQCMTVCSQTNDLFGLSDAAIALGFLEIATGDLLAARAQFLRILQTQDQTKLVVFMLSAVIGMAVLQARAGNPVTALVWTLSVLRHPALHWETQQRAESLHVELQAQLTPDQIAHAQQEASGRSFDAILASVLGQ